MCRIIVINKGEKEISTPREFFEHFSFVPINLTEKISLDGCLCDFDIESTLKNFQVPYKKDCGDIYVGMLEGIIGDEYELDNLTNNFDTVIILE